MEANRTVYYVANLEKGLDDIFNDLGQKFWLQKCCELGSYFTLHQNKCVKEKENDYKPSASGWFSKSLDFCIRYGFPASTDLAAEKLDATAYKLWMNGTLCASNNTSTNRCFALGHYCFDYIPEKHKFMAFGTVPPEEYLSYVDFIAENLPIQFLFITSILLAMVTLALFIGRPDLRMKIHDKSFICYVASLTVRLCITYIFQKWHITSFDEWSNIFYEFIFLSVVFWLNVMCVRLWRSVRSMREVSEGSLLYHSLYAWGCPLILSVAKNPIFQLTQQSEFFNGIRGIYNLMILAAVICFINFCMFIHVAVIIWQQKKKWKRNAEDGYTKHNIKNNQRRWFLIFKLFLIMGLEKNNVFFYAYIGKCQSDLYRLISKIMYNICPGYAVFIIFVCFNKKLCLEVKRKFHSLSDMREKLKKKSKCRNVETEVEIVTIVAIPQHKYNN